MKYRLVCCVLAGLFCMVIHSRSVVFRSLSNSEGLADLTVSAVYKDSVGYIWLGTATSVERFDGIYLKHYPIQTSFEREKYVNCFVETKGDRLWVGTDGGLWQVGQDKVERVAAEVVKNGVRSIVKDSLDVLYIGSESGLHIHKDGKFETMLLENDVFSTANFIIGLWLDGRVLWAITKNGLYSIRLDNRKIVHYTNELSKKESDFSYRNIVRVGSALYIGTMEHGVLSFDLATRKFHRYIDVGCNVIRSLSGDGKEMLYVGSDGNGAYCISTKQNKIVRSFRHELGREGIRSNSVYSFLVDRNGGMWFGLCQMGLDYMIPQDELFSVYKTSYFTSENIPVRTLYIGEKEKLIGSREGLFYIDERNGQFTKFGYPLLRSKAITACCALKDKVYIGTYGGGMYVFDLSTKKIRDFASEQPIPFVNGHIFCIDTDRKGNLWIGTSNGIYRYHEGKMTKHFTDTNSHLPEGNIYTIFFDSIGRGWICTENGVCLWNPETDIIKADIFPEGFANKDKYCAVYEDSAHELYFLPYKGRIFISNLDMTRFHRMHFAAPLEDKNVMFITEDKEGWLWLGTNNGLYRYDKKETFVPYNFADGIPSPIFLACAPVTDEDGTLWFGNSKGLLRLSIDWKQNSDKYNYKMRFSAVHTNGLQISTPIIECGDGEYEIQLDASQKNVTVCFSDLTFIDPAYVSYEYRMEGVDKGWRILTGKSEVTYYNLASGMHTFRVRQMGESGTEACLHVRISSSAGWIWASIALAALAVLSVGLWKRKTNPMVIVRLLRRMEGRTMPSQEEEDMPMKEKYKNCNLSVDECRRMTERLEEVMREKKPYTNPNLKIADLAFILGVSSYSMSYLFNQYLKRNYYNYINDYRVAEFKSLVNKGEHTRYTLDALMKLCGFVSRTTFFRCFKKMHGITPSEYIKNREKSEK